MTRDPTAAAARNQFSRRSFLAGSAIAAVGTAIGAESQSMVEAKAGTQDAAPPLVTHILANWAANCRFADVPPPARKQAVRSIVNWLAATLGGSQQPAVNIALEALGPFSHISGVSLPGRFEKPDALNAGLVTGISAHVLDFDDTDLATIIHPAGAVASALFSLCQRHALSGTDLLNAFVVGVEVECRLGRALYPSHYEMGWHITGTCGSFGSAAACGRLLGLDTARMQMALAIAATEAAGLKVEFGTMCKSLNMGRAAQNGMLAALLAFRGFTGAPDAIEGKGGYVQAASLHHDFSAITRNLGESYEIMRDTFKPFACGIVLHPAIDATLQLRKEYHLNSADIRSIQVMANPLVLQLTGKQNPRDGLEAKFSVYHSVAVALVKGYAGPAEYTTATVHDPGVDAVRRRVTVQTNSNIREDEAIVTITAIDGRVLRKHVEHAIGSASRPLSDDDLNRKYHELVKGILPREQADQVLALAWGLEELPDASALPSRASQKDSAHEK